MQRQDVRSTMISSWGFDHAQQILEIEFTNRRVYQYANVPAFLARGLAAAGSKGAFFRSRIEGRFPAIDVTAASRLRGFS
jgi:hypothetical protein